MATSSSLLFSHLTLPKTLVFSTTHLSISSSPLLNLHSKIPSSFKPLVIRSSCNVGSKSLLSSRFVRNVAVSSEYDQDEEEEDEVFSGGRRQSSSEDLKLFVGNLPFDVDSAMLAGLFERAGVVEMVEVIYDKITGRSRGFAFVTMSSMQEVEAAAQQFNGYELEGRALRVNFGPPPPKEDFGSRSPRSEYGSRGESGYGSRGGSSNNGSRRQSSYGGSRGESSYGSRGESGGSGGGGSSYGSGGDSSNRVYVGNLSWGVDDASLESLFGKKGKVVEAKVVYDRESGRSRGFGFVTYSTADEVNNAVDSLDGADLDGRSIRVNVAEAKPRRQF